MNQVAATLSTRPLCVDLDGTLIRTDLLIESFLRLLRDKPLECLRLPLWLLSGKARLKQEIADRVDIDASELPYDHTVLQYLRRARAENRSLTLVTASNRKFAEAVADHLGLFDHVIASDARANLSGHYKREALSAAYGRKGFDYMANARVDLKVWVDAEEAIAANASRSVIKELSSVTRLVAVLDRKRVGLAQYVRALRAHQWLKNLLVFVPLAMAHKLHDPKLLLQATLAFLAFCLCASAVYVLNDLVDLSADRGHPTKRQRPFAAGDIPIQHGLFLIPLLIVGSALLAAPLPSIFWIVLALYFLITLAYSLRLKRAVLVDVIALAALYTLRVTGGGAATGIEPSFWLLAFSMFFFLSLALVKRYSELLRVSREQTEGPAGRGYRVGDLDMLAQFGVTSAQLSVLVLALYVNSPAVGELYTHSKLIWLICPLLFYWIGRVWILAKRDEMHEDPVIFAIRDPRSYWLFASMALIVFFAA